jgi:hypothetical protein
MNIPSTELFWMLSGFILLVVAWVEFNKPPTNRTNTTFVLFYSGIGFYYALLAALWLLVILILQGTGAGLNWIGLAISSSLKTNADLHAVVPLIAVLIIAVASRFKSLRNIDKAARSLCIELAAIPRQADDLATELAKRTEFRIVDSQLEKDVSREILGNVSPSALNFTEDGAVSYRFTRAVALYWLFIVPFDTGSPLRFPTNAAARSTYTRIMRLNDRIVSNTSKLYEKLIELGREHFTTNAGEHRTEELLTRCGQELSLLVCSLIARYALGSNITVGQRRKRMASMGFFNLQDRLAPFGRDQWIATIVAIIILFSLLSTIIPGGQPFPFALLYSILAAVQLGIASIAGTVVAQRFIRRGERRFPPLTELLVAVLVVIAICIALRIAWFLVPNLIKNGKIDFDRSIDIFMQRWAFLLMPISCTISIGLLCSYLGNLSLNRTRLAVVGGVLNGLAFAFTGLLMSQFLPQDLMPQSHPELANMGIIGTAGTALGAIVLGIFPRSVQREATYTSADVTSGTRILASARPAAEDSLGGVVPSAHPLASQDLGGYSKGAVEELQGRYVCFRPSFSNPQAIIAYLIIIRWDEKHSCLMFQEESRTDVAHTQTGSIYLPDGKPFISFVTIDRGSVRVIMVARPTEGLLRGIVMTLSTPRGTHFTPIAAPVVLRRLGEVATPELGLVQQDAPDYDLYYMQLSSVVPDFGNFAFPASPSAGNDAPVKPENVHRLRSPGIAQKRNSKPSAV